MNDLRAEVLFWRTHHSHLQDRLMVCTQALNEIGLWPGVHEAPSTTHLRSTARMALNRLYDLAERQRMAEAGAAGDKGLHLGQEATR